MSIMLCCKLVEQNQPIASQSTNKGCGQILSFVIEVPVDEVNYCSIIIFFLVE